MTATALVEWSDGIFARATNGTARSVLWLHGYTMDSSLWSELWDLLPGWRHVGIDLPGHGASRPIRAGEDLSVLAARISRAAAAHGIRHVVALSFGTVLAIEMAIRAQGQFSVMVLGSPTLAGGPYEPLVAERYRQLAALYQRLGAGKHMTASWMSSPPDIFTGARRHPVLWRRLQEVIGRHNWVELESGGMWSLMRGRQTTAQLRMIEAACTVIVGDDDMPAHAETAQVIGAEVPRAARVQLPGLGHLCLLESPETVAPHVAAALDRA